jgi:hypothetical protein
MAIMNGMTDGCPTVKTEWPEDEFEEPKLRKAAPSEPQQGDDSGQMSMGQQGNRAQGALMSGRVDSCAMTQTRVVKNESDFPRSATKRSVAVHQTRWSGADCSLQSCCSKTRTGGM